MMRAAIPESMASLLKEHGYSYVCYEEDEGLHYMQKPIIHTPTISAELIAEGWKPVPEQRYNLIRYNDGDVENGNLSFFLTRGYTR